MKLFCQIAVFALLAFPNCLGLEEFSNECGHWLKYKDEKCFKILDNPPETFDDAIESCQNLKIIIESGNDNNKLDDSQTTVLAYNPILPTVLNREEQEFLADKLFGSDSDRADFWIGARFTPKVQSYEWIDGYSRWNYTNWNGQGPIERDNYCVAMKNNGRWSSVPCDTNHHVVCQRLQIWNCGRTQVELLEERRDREDLEILVKMLKIKIENIVIQNRTDINEEVILKVIKNEKLIQKQIQEIFQKEQDSNKQVLDIKVVEKKFEVKFEKFEEEIQKRIDKLEKDEENIRQQISDIEAKEQELNVKITEIMTKEKLIEEQIQDIQKKEQEFHQIVIDVEEKERAFEQKIEQEIVDIQDRDQKIEEKMIDIEKKEGVIQHQIEMIEKKIQEIHQQIVDIQIQIQRENVSDTIQEQIDEIVRKETIIQRQIQEIIRKEQDDFHTHQPSYITNETVNYQEIDEIERKLRVTQKQILELDSKVQNLHQTIVSVETSQKTIENQITVIENKEQSIELEINNIKIKIDHNLPQTVSQVPIGFIYIQYPFQLEPSKIWPSVRWQDVSVQYRGVFFRVFGARSSQWNQIQEGQAPRITDIMQEACLPRFMPGGHHLPINQWSDFIFSGHTFRYRKTWGTRFFTSGAEVRPANMPIRIWKRIG